MDILPKFVDMAKKPIELGEEANEAMSPAAMPQNLYPYGLCICLTQEDLDKLDLSGDVDAGDTIHIHALGKVTSVNKRDTTSGTDMRIEIQLTHLAAEGESDEDAAMEEKSHKLSYKNFYKDE